MSRTFAIYQDTEHGRLRLGLFTCRGTMYSVREVSRQYFKRYPHAATYGQLFVAARRRIFGKYVDDPPVPMDIPDDKETT